MRQVLLRAAYVVRRPAIAPVVLLLMVGGALLVWVPLFGLPGFELSLALSLGVGLLGGAVGIAAGRLERRMIQGRDPRPAGALRLDWAIASVSSAMGAALAVNLLAVLVPFGVASVYAAVATPCDPFAQVGFFPLLVLPSALLASAAGVFCGLSSTRALRSGLLYAGLVALSAAATLWPVLTGPQVFAFNHFAGYFPGPLYDEALRVPASLGWFRLETLLWAGLLWAGCALTLDLRDGSLGRPGLRPGSALLAIAAAAGIFVLEDRATTLRMRTSHGALADHLGGRRESAHFVLTYWRGKPTAEVERFVRDLEFHHAQLSAFLGKGPEGRIQVFLYRSPEEKQALVGAARTQFAKPWLLEVHVNDSRFPHPVLKHELVHVMAAPFGSGPFKVTARFAGLWPNMGIIEGMAVAGDDPVDELTLHAWAAGMRRHQLMPDIRRMLQPQRFYSAAPARAYMAAGSFLRYLGETHGAEKLRALYAAGDFQAAYGTTLPALATEWERFLDSLPLDEEAVNLAFARFRRGSIFARPCAREVARLQQEAASTLQSDPQQALEDFRRCRSIQPDEPAFHIGFAQALSRLDRKAEATEVLRKLEQQVKEHPALAADAAMALADVAWARGRKEEAQAALERVLAARVSPSMDRTARVKLAAIASPRTGPALWAYFKPGGEELKLLLLREALDAQPGDAHVAYLLGRRLAQANAPSLAVGYLGTALAGPLADSLRREALRLRIESEYLAGDCSAVKATLGQLPDLGEAFERYASSWEERCDFEQKTFNGALVPEAPL